MKKIPYHDLRQEAFAGRLPPLIGREEELERLDRTMSRRINGNALVVAPDGMGKSTFVYGWMRRAARATKFAQTQLLQLDAAHVHAVDGEAVEEQYAEALATLPQSVIFIDDFGREVHRNQALMQRVYRLYKDLVSEGRVSLLLSLEPHEYSWIEREHPAFASLFEVMRLKAQSAHEQSRVLGRVVRRLNARYRVIISDETLREIVAQAERFPSLGQMPRSAIRLLDETIAHAAIRGDAVLGQDSIAAVVGAKTGVPKAHFGKGDLRRVKEFEAELTARIVGQDDAIRKIAATLQRAALGLRNPQRPLGSFLLLGPSGVGKTETARCVAESVFGRRESFVRFDMSEFQQDHTVQRLIGAPAGYVGYEEGGALTNALRKEPYSLVLLDEIEKAHPKVFDLFLQVLDDGRLTSGQNETVDARNAIFMATSNAAVCEIIEAFAKGNTMDEDSLMREKVLPALAKTFRFEFINRFDSILVFQPLTKEALGEIALLEIRKIEKRLARHRVRFEMEPSMREKLAHMVDPRFGARPVKRFIEETCEALLADALLNNSAI